MTYRAAIIIPHYNDLDRLMTCLSALMPLPADVQCVVVDNGSDMDLTPVCQTYPEVQLIVETQRGAAMARNRGVEETTAPLLFFLDSDCVPSPDWTKTALAVSERADLVGGAVSVFDETPPPRTGAQAFEAVFAFDNEAYVRDKGFSVTANLLTRRAVFEATGPFHPGVSEDMDWCHRARKAGYALAYAPELKVAHPSRGDWQSLKRKWRRLTVELCGVNGNGAIARLKWALRAGIMPLSALAHAPRVLLSPKLSGTTERFAALGTLCRLRLIRAWWMLRQSLGFDI